MSAIPLEDKFFNLLSAMLAVPRDQLDHATSRETVPQWDSLKHMHLMLALEDEFNVEFDDDEVSDLSSAAALLGAIAAKGGK